MDEVVYLSLGSNVGDRDRNLRAAIRALGVVGRVKAVSSFYETEPVDFVDQAWFLNCAVALESVVSPERMMAELLRLEQKMGRERIQKKGPRTIDIDILMFGERIVDSPDLKIPHPAMQSRRFVLAPLAEIAPEAKHPVMKRTVRELLAELPERQVVRKLRGSGNSMP
jgi:2-amino-4-hydroxy-6-hydroxymethyldihydropteridine diphosphokinase